VNRKQLVKSVADSTGLTQDQVDTALGGVVDTVTAAVKSGDKVVLPGFVSFEQTQRSARTGRNPQTGESMTIGASSGVKLSAVTALKNKVKNG